MDVKTGFFYLFSVVLLFAAFRVITARNPVHAVLHLMLAFSQASAIWLLLKAEFLAITLVLVYLGAVMVLFLFVVMMLDIKIDTMRQSFWKHFPLAATLGAGGAEAYSKAAAEYVAGERFDADRPENRTNLGGYYAERGQFAEAEAEIRAAIALDPSFVPAWVNLADTMRMQAREADAESALREGLKHSPSDATLHHALGLSLVRQKKNAEALRELKRATELAPGNARFAYVYGVAKTELAGPAAQQR